MGYSRLSSPFPIEVGNPFSIPQEPERSHSGRGGTDFFPQYPTVTRFRAPDVSLVQRREFSLAGWVNAVAELHLSPRNTVGRLSDLPRLPFGPGSSGSSTGVRHWLVDRVNRQRTPVRVADLHFPVRFWWQRSIQLGTQIDATAVIVPPWALGAVLDQRKDTWACHSGLSLFGAPSGFRSRFSSLRDW